MATQPSPPLPSPGHGLSPPPVASPLGLFKLDKPAYSTPPPAENTPANNVCRMIDYRGAKVAAFTVDGREVICLPQAFDLFLKHLVGGLHTVYTKLKRLDITPVVCNVEQVRILRGLGAIQPGVNRCKLLSKEEFDILYEDCTNSSSRPGRPPKRAQPPLMPPLIHDHKKMHLENGDFDFTGHTPIAFQRFSPLGSKSSDLKAVSGDKTSSLVSSSGLLAIPRTIPTSGDKNHFLPNGLSDHPVSTTIAGLPFMLHAAGAIPHSTAFLNVPHSLAAVSTQSRLPESSASVIKFDRNGAESEQLSPNSTTANSATKEKMSPSREKTSSTSQDEGSKGKEEGTVDSLESPDSHSEGNPPLQSLVGMAPFLPENISSTETLLTNIQGLLKVAADNARQQEKQVSMEKAELKMELLRERELREALEKQLGEEQRSRAVLQKRLKKEKKAKRKMLEQLEQEQRRRIQAEDGVKQTSSDSLRVLNESLSQELEVERNARTDAERKLQDAQLYFKNLSSWSSLVSSSE
ncbi:PREDICTED: dachshund homolog 2-like isoform X3 [Branchiostoma belcheri]|uniref:Dachshund homolog 2-like isoform X3 n=1 Tax=Branchiostoma belcheri TaxID=7741 RepID=A0A6P4ZXH6_BRABE|nr:PREDICTED: dachshund homolog 2-like isoform X3 [Branchiostoma belcheri]